MDEEYERLPLVVPPQMLADARALGFSVTSSEPMPVWHGFSFYVDSSPQGNRHQRRSFAQRRRATARPMPRKM